MKITYLYHSGFAVELEKHILIFDYFKGTLPEWEQDKTILCFVSHKHSDHFDFKIFDLYGQYKKIHYFLGSDIRLSDKYLQRNGVDPVVKETLTNVGKHTVTRWQDVTIETLRSTDAGVAWIVTAEGKTIYHAGDLNWWHWEGEEPAWNRKMEADYKKEIDRISGRYFDAAFVPLDPRLEATYDLGMRVFLERTDAGAVFPMHMWDQYEVISGFRQSEAGRSYADRIMEIREPGQEFIL